MNVDRILSNSLREHRVRRDGQSASGSEIVKSFFLSVTATGRVRERAAAGRWGRRVQYQTFPVH